MTVSIAMSKLSADNTLGGNSQFGPAAPPAIEDLSLRKVEDGIEPSLSDLQLYHYATQRSIHFTTFL